MFALRKTNAFRESATRRLTSNIGLYRPLLLYMHTPMYGYMGVFTTHERSNYETVASETIEWNGYHLKYELREYDLYERFFVSKGTRRRQQIRLRAYDGSPHETTFTVGRKEKSWSSNRVAEHKSTWDKDAQPRSTWAFQVNAITSTVKDQLCERDDYAQKLTDNIPESVRKDDEDTDDEDDDGTLSVEWGDVIKTPKGERELMNGVLSGARLIPAEESDDE